MSDFKIVCTDQVPVNEPTTHAHIVAVGIDTDLDGYAEVKHTKQQVVDNINNRVHRYYTTDPTGQQIAWVEVQPCAHCRMWIIRSTPDSTHSNNLDYLRRCSWT